MMNPCSRRSAVAMLANALLLPATAVQASSSAPIKWVVGYPAGAASDYVARVVSHQLGVQLSRTVVVDNRPGAAGAIAARTVVNAAADGTTVLSGDNGILVFNSALFKNPAYDPEKDLKSIGLYANATFLLLANSNSKYTNIQDVVEAMRRQPGKIQYATPGIASPHNLAMEMLKEKVKLSAAAVHYRGGAAAIQDVMGGHIELIVLDAVSATPALQAGQLKPLGVFSKKRLPAYPQVPSTFELGYTDVEMITWSGLVVPAATPESVRKSLSDALIATMRVESVRAKIREQGGEPISSTAEEMDQLRRTEMRHWVPLIRSRGISVD